MTRRELIISTALIYLFAAAFVIDAFRCKERLAQARLDGCAACEHVIYTVPLADD